MDNLIVVLLGVVGILSIPGISLYRTKKELEKSSESEIAIYRNDR